MPLPYRWLTSLMTRFNGSTLMIDCGEGTQIAVREKGWSCNPIDVICFTHYHGDHISGLPGLLLTMGNADRTEPLTLIGPKGLERVVNALRVIAPELPFPIIFKEITQNEQDFEVKGYHIHAFRVQHNVTCYGYTIQIPRAGRFHAEKAKELGIPLTFWSHLQKGETMTDGDKVYTPDMVMGEKRKGIKVTYVTFSEAASLAKEAQPKEMWLTHYSPSLAHPEEYIEETRKIFSRTIAAKDGRSISLDFEQEEGTK